MKETEKILKDGDKFLILLDSIMELIDKWKENYVPTPEKDVVPDVLDFEPGGTAYYVTSFGDIEDYMFDYEGEEEATHRAFKTREMAEMFADKTQVIADMLHFKQLYDADFEPDFNNVNSEKYTILMDITDKEYIVCQPGRLYSEESVYFSSEEIAQKCAVWLNEKRKRETQ